MNETPELPERRPMPEGLRNRLWAEIEPQLEERGPGDRFRAMRAPLAAAAAVVVLAVGLAVALPRLGDHGDTVPATSPEDARLVDECVQAAHGVLPPGRWRAGARIDVDAENGFLAIRDDQYAAVCVLKNDKGVRLTPNEVSTRRVYGNLTAARPFDYLDSENFDYPITESIHFGIATSDVTAVSLVGPDNSVTPGIVRDGTFAVRTKFPESSGEPTTNHVRATLKNGQVVVGSFR
ncbi:hypothetical protein [Amycolatopsis dongchuanensis]|uniref:Uncharacterized protein n=1 Tax=Amycolatopsis dongchuanensis TaxID=1070866 RepID=A0ABP9QB73_9PSEU